MSTAPAGPAATTFLTSLTTGVLDLAFLHGHPREDAAAREYGDRLVSEARAFLGDHADPEAIDDTRTLPDELVTALQEGGYLRLGVPKELGGLDLPPHTAFRLISLACAHSTPVGQMLAIQNGVGAAAMLPALPPGPLHDFVAERVARGTVSGFGDTESAGQNNVRKTLTATPAPGGYVLRGAKLFTGNGPIADLIAVSVTVTGGERPRTGACFLDTATPGFSVQDRIEFMGSRGLPNGSLRFDDVFVPADQILLDPATDNLPPLIGLAALLGRILFTGAPALAIARQCLVWTRDFTGRRSIDGRGLGTYDEIRRLATASLADVYAMEAVTHWALLDFSLTERWFERFAAKNVLVHGAWGIVDRTVSLFGAEGFETVASKRRRGAVPVPLERAFRDARGLRIAGNVDFRLDHQLGRTVLASLAGAPAAEAARDASGDGLPALLASHVRTLAGQVAGFRHVAVRFLRDTPADRFDEREHTVGLLGRLARELFTVAAVLSRYRAEGTPEGAPWDAAELADAHCTEAWHRVTLLTVRLAEAETEAEAEAEPGAHRGRVADRWLAGPAPDPLARH